MDFLEKYKKMFVPLLSRYIFLPSSIFPYTLIYARYPLFHPDSHSDFFLFPLFSILIHYRGKFVIRANEGLRADYSCFFRDCRSLCTIYV